MAINRGPLLLEIAHAILDVDRLSKAIGGTP